MFANSGSLELLNDGLKGVLVDSAFNSFPVVLAHSWIGNFIMYLLIHYTITTLYHQQVSMRRHLLAAAICSILYQLPIFLCHLFFNIKIMSIKIVHLLVLYPPYFLIILYFVLVYILKINKYKCIHIVNHCYYLIMNTICLYYLAENVFFHIFTSDRKFQFFIFILSNSLTFLSVGIIAVAAMRYIRKESLWLEDFVQRADPNPFRLLLSSLIKASMIFSFLVLLIHHIRYSGDITLICSVLVCFLVANTLQTYLRFTRNRLIMYQFNHDNKVLHIASLIESINRFSAVKHDFDNMMQVYDGYIATENYGGLKRYHQSMYRLVVNTSERIELTKRMKDNPALYSILLAKAQQASGENVLLRISCMADASRISIHPLDFSRMLGILLDNAIEESSKTEKRTVHFYMEQKSDEVILISISNPTVGEVDVKDIFKAGYTTKENHSGIGLAQVWSVITRTKSCSMDTVYLNNMITFYLEIRCLPKGDQQAVLESLPVLSTM